VETSDKIEREAQDAIRQLQSGSPHGLRRLVDCLGPRMFSFLKSLLGSAADAEDALQETFITICGKASQQNSEIGSVKGWAYKIARNHGLQILRHRQSDSRKIPAPQSSPPNPAQALDRALLLEDVDRALESVPVELKMPFLMRECLELTYEQIAELTDKSVNQVAAEIYRARQLLREYVRT